MQTVDSRATEKQLHRKLDINRWKIKIITTPCTILWKSYVGISSHPLKFYVSYGGIMQWCTNLWKWKSPPRGMEVIPIPIYVHSHSFSFPFPLGIPLPWSSPVGTNSLIHVHVMLSQSFQEFLYEQAAYNLLYSLAYLQQHRTQYAKRYKLNISNDFILYLLTSIIKGI